jgi:hypothetical protein
MEGGSEVHAAPLPRMHERCGGLSRGTTTVERRSVGAVIEMLIGQLYLVTVIGLLIVST